jgi:biopolymer transport protein ExbD
MLLLIFFMASTTTEPPGGIEVELPASKTSSAEQDSVYITIAKNSRIYLNGGNVTLRELDDYLAMHQGEKDRSVSITADKNLNYTEVADVLSVLQGRDFLNVVFMSVPETGEKI